MEASFGAGAFLSTIGIACMKKVQDPEQLLFAGIPLLFAFQQFSEGVLWLSLSNPVYASWQQPTTSVFLVLAHIIWPLFIPASLLLLEKESKRKRILLLLLFTGAILSAYFSWYLFFHDVQANAVGHHIFYERNFPGILRMFINVGYALTAVLPLFISSMKKMWMLGLLFFLSFLVAKIVYTSYVISVWCFFAAILSGIVYFIIRERRYEGEV